ncbi:MAG: riboflavin biosynthesis protein RibF, partial [Pseudomonadota bacterium]
RYFFQKDQKPDFQLCDDPDFFIYAQKARADWVVLLDFNDQLVQLTPQDFVNQCLKQHLNISDIFVGQDFRFGYRRSGDIATLKDAGLHVESIELLKDHGQVVSSTAIRSALENGDIVLANQMLGRRYKVRGRVIKGSQLGQKLGFPTANLDIKNYVRIKHGIYCARVYQASKKIGIGALYSGCRPTLDGVEERFEVYILNFDGNLYGQILEIEIDQKIRDDQSFDDIIALKKQMALDCAQIHQFYQDFN